MSNYVEQYKDPKWQKKRLEIFERDNWACQGCFEKDKTLHVHHRFYLKELKPWEYPNTALITLCETCHEYETENLPIALSELNFAFRAIGYMTNHIMALARAMGVIFERDTLCTPKFMCLILDIFRNPEYCDKVSDFLENLKNASRTDSAKTDMPEQEAGELKD